MSLDSSKELEAERSRTMPDKVGEFQRKYHDYIVQTKEEAVKEVEQIGTVDGHTIIPVHFPGIGWSLMVDTAYEEVKRLGIVE